MVSTGILALRKKNVTERDTHIHTYNDFLWENTENIDPWFEIQLGIF